MPALSAPVYVSRKSAAVSLSISVDPSANHRNAQLERDVRVYPIAEVLDDIFRADIGVLDLVRQIFDHFEQYDPSEGQLCLPLRLEGSRTAGRFYISCSRLLGTRLPVSALPPTR